MSVKITKQEIYTKLLELAKYYVPEWNTQGAMDVGMLLYQIFAEQMEDTIQLYHIMPERNFIAFLNILGADTLASTPATGYATIHMNKGDYTGVPIKKGTRLFCEKEGEERILYETKNDFLAVPNQIEAIYCTTSDKNFIVSAYNIENEKKEEIVLFDFNEKNNLQQYYIILCSESIFYINEKGNIMISLFYDEKKYMAQKTAEVLGNSDMVIWEVLTEQGWRRVKSVKTIDTSILLEIGFTIPVLEEKETKQRNRFLKCTFLQKSDVPLVIKEIKISSACNNLKANYLYYNDFLLSEENGLPFGQQYHVYDAFYINCEEAFCKKNAVITIDISIFHEQYEYDEILFERAIKWKSIVSESAVQEPKKLPITIEEVIWEYWNGTAWKRLFLGKEFSDFFAGEEKKREQMIFRCPEDIEKIVVGAENGYFIRARILRISNLFAQYKYYNVPVLERITISYKDFSPQAKPDMVYIKRDMESIWGNSTQQKEILLLPAKQWDLPTCYIALSQAMQGGTIQMFFQNAKSDRQNAPAIKWEYFGEQNGIEKWIPLQVLDETNFFAQSGLLNYMIHCNMKRKNLFQKDCFWLRGVNTDGRYDNYNEQKPSFTGIYFNTVKVIQQETMEEMYFYIAPEQKNKKCTLLSGNVVKLEVFIKEESHWTKWKEVSDFSICNEQSKVYVADKKVGEVFFGDGKKGKIPPSDDGATIHIKYAICEGEKGNCLEKELTDFADSVPFVDYVTNNQAISGGCDIESTQQAVKRCKNILKVQNRAISAEDYEILCKQADRNVMQVKVLQNEHIQKTTSILTLAILPREIGKGESFFSEIRQHIKQMILKKAPITIANRIDIIQVKYIAYSIKVELTIDSYEYYQSVYDHVEKKLSEYINPITGNFDGKGFLIGQLPTTIKIHHLLKTIDYISDINILHINYYDCINENWQEISWETAKNCVYAVPVNGTHEIYVNVRYTN